MSGSAGPTSFDQRILEGASAAPMFIAGIPMTANFSSFEIEIPGRAVFSQALGGGYVHQGTLESAAAPRSLSPIEFELEVATLSEDQMAFLMAGPARAASGTLEVWFDHWIVDTWTAQGQTQFVLARSTFYGGGPSFSSRPARVFVDGVEQDVVDGSPAPGEFGIDQGNNDNILTAGTAPDVGSTVDLRYYPLMIGDLSWEGSIEDRNKGDMSVTFTEFPRQRKYE